MLDKISTNLGFSLLPISFPKKIAMELLATIPKIEPKISEILWVGYCKPRPREAKNVLSPSSPIIMLIAIIKI